MCRLATGYVLCGVQVAQLTPQQILAHISSMTPQQVSTMLPLPSLPRDEALLRLTTQVHCRHMCS